MYRQPVSGKRWVTCQAPYLALGTGLVGFRAAVRICRMEMDYNEVLANLQYAAREFGYHHTGGLCFQVLRPQFLLVIDGLYQARASPCLVSIMAECWLKVWLALEVLEGSETWMIFSPKELVLSLHKAGTTNACATPLRAAAIVLLCQRLW